jgi:hypothetical protein
MLLLLKQMAFVREKHLFFHKTGQSYLEQNEPLSTFETLIGCMRSFHKLTLFSQRNNVLDAESYNVEGFLWKDSCFSCTQLNRPF